MPPQAILLLFIAMFSFIYLMMRAKSSHELKKLDKMMGAKTSDNSLTTGELESMILQAVTQAMQPVSEKIEAMEDRMTAMEQQVGPVQQIEPDLLDPMDQEPSRQKTLGRVPRSRTK
jgi:hypothetical protein